MKGIVFALIIGLLSTACMQEERTQDKLAGVWQIERVYAADTTDVSGSAAFAFAKAKYDIEAFSFSADSVYKVLNSVGEVLEEKKYLLKDENIIHVFSEEKHPYTYEIIRANDKMMELQDERNTRIILKKE